MIFDSLRSIKQKLTVWLETHFCKTRAKISSSFPARKKCQTNSKHPAGKCTGKYFLGPSLIMQAAQIGSPYSNCHRKKVDFGGLGSVSVKLNNVNVEKILKKTVLSVLCQIHGLIETRSHGSSICEIFSKSRSFERFASRIVFYNSFCISTQTRYIFRCASIS